MKQGISSATGFAHPNIAFIKYWGNRNEALNLPSTGSISMSLGSLWTKTCITIQPDLKQDELFINGNVADEASHQRLQHFLDQLRRISGISACCSVKSDNNFPTAAGIASSASAYAALTVAACKIFNLPSDPIFLSRLARLGSGSACRSIAGGFVEWYAGEDDKSSYAESFAPPSHWQLCDCIAIVSEEPKKTASRIGHRLAQTSPIQRLRVDTAAERLNVCKSAILTRDFNSLADVAEFDSNLMHAVMMTSNPPLFYWAPGTIRIMHSVQEWRQSGLPVFYTVDAGANVHVICPKEYEEVVASNLLALPEVRQVIPSGVGDSAKLIEDDSGRTSHDRI